MTGQFKDATEVITFGHQGELGPRQARSIAQASTETEGGAAHVAGNILQGPGLTLCRGPAADFESLFGQCVAVAGQFLEIGQPVTPHGKPEVGVLVNRFGADPPGKLQAQSRGGERHS